MRRKTGKQGCVTNTTFWHAAQPLPKNRHRLYTGQITSKSSHLKPGEIRFLVRVVHK